MSARIRHAKRAVVLASALIAGFALLACSEETPLGPGTKQQQQVSLPEAAEGEFPGLTFVAKERAVVRPGGTVQGSIAVVAADDGSRRPRLTVASRATVHGSVWADSIEIERRARIAGDVSANSIENDGTIDGKIVSVAVPLALELPEIPPSSPGSDDVEVRRGSIRELPPGRYGEWDLGRRDRRASGAAELYLTGGVYDVEKIELDGEVSIFCRAACDVRIADELQLKRQHQVAPAPQSGLTARDVIVTVFEGVNARSGRRGRRRTPDAVSIDRGGRIHGFVHAPYGKVVLNKNAQFLGKVVAQELELDIEVEAEDCATVDATCDGVDDDCDGLIDEDYAIEPSTCGVGACARAATTACQLGVEVDLCTPGTPAADDATCDGADNDCDGTSDEDFVEGPISCGVGACRSDGVTQCVNGVQINSCVPGEPAERDATCDGIDDNCDGVVDDGFQPTATSCGLGTCAAAGHTQCTEAGPTDTCSPGVPAVDDSTCNGLDDDCDGTIDEDFLSQATNCGVGACAALGASVCLGGTVVDQCQPGAPAPSDVTCDGNDDDCDGAVDEDYQAVATSCGVGICAAAGSRACLAGVVVDSCQPQAGASVDATCDGVDEDCDGAVDEDYAPVSTSCGEGACVAGGMTACFDGQEIDSCVSDTGADNDATCDGIDNDCDGHVDEDFAGISTLCGVGACQTTGVTSCVSGVLSDSCEPLPPGLDDAACDGLDNDCDGAVDEEFSSTVIVCGQGACAATGQTACVAGAVVSSCEPGTPAGSDATCDGVDDDCDGEVDEDYASVSTSCGVGSCGAAGQTSCLDGVIVSSCSPGTPAALDATCDGIDDDCDGEVDEDYVSAPTNCGEGACRAAGATSCVGGLVSNSCVPGQPADTDSVCDGVDQDCDGEVDEDFVGLVTSCGVGACADSGLQACVSGRVEDSCAVGVPSVGDFSCDGIDDDCDGTADEDYITEMTLCGVGACHAGGSTSCIAGSIRDSCTPGAPSADDAACNGIDDDCDGAVDEDYPSTTTTCGVGACSTTGTLSCLGGEETDTCEPFDGDALDTTCDGVDDDCDGTVDEDFAPLSTTCGLGACSQAGATTCVDGIEEDSCQPGTAGISDTSCDGVDNDCDGSIDEDYAPQTTSCGQGACAASGLTSCAAGVEQNSCQPLDAAEDDGSCDGVDDDCDGAIDEDFLPTPVSCGVGACAADGLLQCIEGSAVESCVAAEPGASDNSCDGVDNDCDGETDEDYDAVATSCGMGACASSGTTACQAGALVDSCLPGSPALDDTTCDGVDDDCDGAIDEDFVATSISCGVGACASEGTTQCLGGTVVEHCEPGSPATSDSTCNGIDEDCDGTIDEDFAPQGTSCGIGFCATEGTLACVDGTAVDSCEPSSGDLSDSTCDGVDDDCDGEIDEDYVPFGTTCGEGSCLAEGFSSCESGQEVDSCAPGTAAADDATCDGLDNDCDGEIDEDFASAVTSCGVGGCTSEGATSCLDGILSDSCAPTTPASSDAACDGVDNDCDGAVDEDFVPIATDCGVGACRAAGETACLGGAVVDSCSPGSPASGDTTCDGVDDNCNGEADEGYLSSSTSCGIGACSAVGATSCLAGVVSDSCQPHAPNASDATCDGEDDDCDGAIDEDYAPVLTSCGVGACGAEGTTSCVAGVLSNSCAPGSPALSDGGCDGVDDDCDGEIDEEFVGTTTTCGLGACRASGIVSCVNGTPTDSCEPLPPGNSDTSCDGVDNDCDGSIDEDYLSQPTACGTGACAQTGTSTCVAGTELDSCTPGTPAVSDESCDSIDNDCDGLTDEDYVPRGTSCGIGACSANGATTCSIGIEVDSCAPAEPAMDDSACDGVDEDCDGLVDEDYEAVDTACGVGACGAVGQRLCIAGVVADSCVPRPPAGSDSSCNAIDDDCDGTIDEDYEPELMSCGVGGCLSTGQTECVAGSVALVCEPGAPAPDDANCDAIDDDCDGRTDEDFTPGVSSCGVGACAAEGSTQCLLGVVSELCAPGVPAADDALCDGIDNDCDEQVDEDYAPLVITCGRGACTASGSTECVAGAVANQCTPGPAAAEDTNCDGADDDCDGAVDEDYVSRATSCGVGQCASVGSTSCVSAVETDNCEPGGPALADAACDGLDDDCDGQLDEDYTPTSTSCGVGACAALGELICVAGSSESTCEPGAAAASDATCDGIDDDCDGEVDEDFVPEEISCGVGACVTTGTTQCAGGSLLNDCAPLTPPSAIDDSCDGIDSDCNGAVDEDYTGRDVSCGQGECLRTVQTTCVAGLEDTTCTPAFPTFDDDPNCDGRDNDCDGAVDEDFVGSPVSCGVGACVSSGLTACLGGSIQEQCEPGQPADDDSVCNGLDDDCDGSVDEDFEVRCLGSAFQTCEAGVLRATECSNGDVCDGLETCIDAGCQAGPAPSIEDANPCTIGSCDPVSGVLQSPSPLGTSCGNGNVCDGTGSCLAVPVIDSEPQDPSVAVGQPLSLFVQASGSMLRYQWYRDGEQVVGATSPTFTVPSAQLGDDGSVYYVVVSNLTGEVQSREATVTVGDDLGPVLELGTPPVVTTFSDPFTVQGVAVDASTGVASVWVENDQFPGLKIAATFVQASGAFSADVPLLPGLNQLTVVAADEVGNESTSQILATLQLASAPVIHISAPLSGAVVQTDRVDVTGTVRTSLQGSQVRIELAGQTVFPTGSSGEYPFTFEDVILSAGLNQLAIVATTPEGSVGETLEVFYGDDSTIPLGDPPQISLVGMASVVYATRAENQLSGTVVADTCVQAIAVNGAPVQPIGTGESVSFDTIITVPNDGSRFAVLVEAIDCFGRSSTVGFEAIYDALPPVLALSVATAPELNLVQETPYRVSGSVSEPNLAGITIGNQSVGAVPAGADSWEFEFDVPLVAGVEKELTLTIWDQAGNRIVRSILLELDATLEMTWISPENGSELSTLDDPVAIEAVIRVPGLASDDVVSARLDTGPLQPMGGTGAVRSTTFSTPLASGAHTVTAQVLGADGTPKAQSSTRFTIVDANDLPVEVATIDPARGATNAEASQPIALTFTRPVDSALLQVRVTETGRAMTYKQEEAGADLVTMRHPELIEVSRSNDPTPGGLSALPGDRSFIFYPQRDYVYTGDVRTTVTYDGQEVFTSNFKVRKPPTLMEGLVFDQEMNALPGISVELGESTHSTKTDRSGAYSFGFGTVEQAIEGGRQLVTVNPNQRNPKYGSLEFYVNLQQGRYTQTGAFRIPRLDLNEPYRSVSGGDASVSFLDGALVMDFSDASLIFSTGATTGLLHAHPVNSSEFSFPTQGSLYPVFSFAMNPIGVDISGPTHLEFAFPSFATGSDYVHNLPRYLVIAGVDPTTRMLVPVGVGEVDRESGTFASRGEVWFERLDLVTIAFLTDADSAILEDYANGDASLNDLRSAAQ